MLPLCTFTLPSRYWPVSLMSTEFSPVPPPPITAMFLHLSSVSARSFPPSVKTTFVIRLTPPRILYISRPFLPQTTRPLHSTPPDITSSLYRLDNPPTPQPQHSGRGTSGSTRTPCRARLLSQCGSGPGMRGPHQQPAGGGLHHRSDIDTISHCLQNLPCLVSPLALLAGPFWIQPIE